MGIQGKCDCLIQTTYDRGRDARGRGEVQEDRYTGIELREERYRSTRYTRMGIVV